MFAMKRLRLMIVGTLLSSVGMAMDMSQYKKPDTATLKKKLTEDQFYVTQKDGTPGNNPLDGLCLQYGWAYGQLLKARS